MTEYADPSKTKFMYWVRSALRLLYDSPSLENHPLAHALAHVSADGLGRAQGLRRELLRAIHGLRPPDTVPSQSPDWRIYRLLELRYIEALSPDEAMDRLALQKSQFFADQARALEYVGGRLWELYVQTREPDSLGSEVDTAASIEAEIAQLCAHARLTRVDVAQLFDGLRGAVESLAETHGARAVVSQPVHGEFPRANRILLRQAILNAVSYALNDLAARMVWVTTFHEEMRHGICVRAQVTEAMAALVGEETAHHRLALSRRFVEAMNGMFKSTVVDGNRWEASMIWCPSPTPTLLVVDDNAGIQQLYRRLLSGHRWRLVCASSGVEARRMIAEVRPTLIALDVLMPHEDGWDLLQALKRDASTHDIPVLVCSVLEEPELALSLGAEAYLPKPITEDSLLRSLAPWE